MNIEKTCGNCPHATLSGKKGWEIVGCKKTGFIIPHHAVYHEEKITFWRVPPECPRKDSEVLKCIEKAPTNDWVIKSFSDFKNVEAL